MTTWGSPAAALALLCAACGSVAMVNGDGFVLHSPFGPEATETWRGCVARELRGVRDFVGGPPPTSAIHVYLDAVDVEPGADLIAQLAPSVDGALGWTVGAEVHVLVPRAHEGRFSVTAARVLRHEFVHALRPDEPAWLAEGWAHEVEDAVWTQTGLRPHPAPVQIELARAFARTFDESRLWNWDGAPRADVVEETAFRVLSRAVVRCSMESSGSHGTQRPAPPTEWRKWLEEWDIARTIDAATKDADPDLRAAAANALPSLAEFATTARDRVPGIERSVDARTDSLALKLAASDDPALAEPAGRYLVYYRARDVAESALHDLSVGTAPPWSRLVALAVAKRRGGDAAPSEVTALWDALSDDERRRFLWLPSFLPVGDQPRSAGD